LFCAANSKRSRRATDTEYNLATPRERGFMGDVSMLQAHRSSVRPESHRKRPRYFHIPAAELRRALAEIPAVSKTIV
jgi:hypothetical protein